MKSKFLEALDRVMKEVDTTTAVDPSQAAAVAGKAIKDTQDAQKKAAQAQVQGVHAVFASNPDITKALQSGDASALSKALQNLTKAATTSSSVPTVSPTV